MKKNLFTTVAFALLLIALSACKRTTNYPELSVELTDSLKQTDIPGVFISGAKQLLARPEADTSNFCPTACASKKVYWIQVTYPVTICTDPEFPNTVFHSYEFSSRDSALKRIIADIPVSNMVTKKSIRGFDRLNCKTSSGPWVAKITDTEMCDNPCGPGSHKFEMVILGVPEDLIWVWWDSMDNKPTVVNYIGEPFMQQEVISDCNPNDLTNCI